MTVISNGTNLINNGALDSAVPSGKLILLSTQTANNSANLSFTSGINSTYDSYVFKFINIHPVSTNRIFSVNFRDGSSAFDASKYTNSFRAVHGEDGNSGAVAYTGNDDINGTGDASLANGVGAGNDESLSGELALYFPSSTASVKHFIAVVNFYEDSNISVNHFTSGFCNTTTAIDGARFQMSSGNISTGIIKLYGVA